MVIGLEVHCELKTKTKIFCGCSTQFGAPPNTQVCPGCLGMPGTLPVLNEKVVEHAVRAGMATNCTIARFCKQDRKNYYYPDLPRGYQISQLDLPLCEHGWLEIESENGAKKIGITRIHIEEDAGKLVHDAEKGTLVDCNRCGMPLIEIVSEPDIRSAEEAVAYVRKLRAVLLYTGVSDCKMQEGSLRCDVNLSVRKLGTEKFGVRAEMKNLNSFVSIQKAIEYEYRRQVEEIERGGTLVQETRRYDQESGKTFSMRRKEDADDYRYFPDPDLAPIVLTEDELAALRATIPQLPDDRKAIYTQKYGLTVYDAELITGDIEVADYFERAVADTQHPKLLANLLISEILKLLEPDDIQIPVSPRHMAQVAQMLGEGVINSSVGKKIIKAMWENDVDPVAYVDQNGLRQINDPETLRQAVSEALAADEKSVEAYRKGKTNAAKALMGQAMAKTSGKANPVLLEKLLLEQLEG